MKVVGCLLLLVLSLVVVPEAGAEEAFGSPIYPDIYNMTACGPGTLIVVTADAVQELSWDGGAWKNRKIGPNQANWATCSSDGAFLAIESSTKREFFWRSGKTWQSIAPAETANLEETRLFAGADSLLLVPNHITRATSDAVVRRYRRDGDSYKVDATQLAMGPILDFAADIKKTSAFPDSASIELLEREEGGFTAATLLENVLAGGSGAPTVLIFRFSDALVSWIAWKASENEQWNFGRLPDEAWPEMAKLSDPNTLTITATAGHTSRSLLPLDAYRCPLQMPFECNRVLSGNLPSGEAIVAVSLPLYLIEDSERQCFRMAAIDGGTTPCYDLAKWPPIYFEHVAGRAVVAFGVGQNDSDGFEAVPLYDLPLPQ